MRRDIFRRGVRMIQRYGDLEERGDPLSSGTFDPQFPERLDSLSKPGASPSLEISEYGEHQYREAPSPVCKPGGGYASLSGPKPDMPQIFGMPVPVGTKRRYGPPRTDK